MNRRHRDFQSHALPAELPRHMGNRIGIEPTTLEPQSRVLPLNYRLHMYRHRELNSDLGIRSPLSYPLYDAGASAPAQD